VVVRGKVDTRDDSPKLVAIELERLQPDETGTTSLCIDLTRTPVDGELLEQLKAVLHEHPGQSEVNLRLSDRQVVRLPDEFCVEAGNGLVAELRVMLGRDAVTV
jgi:DNA polymerase-3 subunit alpha